jgi:hypothetical protein
MYAVGEEGTILHFDGDSWTKMDSGTKNTLYGVHAAGPNDVYAVGGSTVLHFDGVQWSEIPGPGVSTKFRDVVCSEGRVYLAGGSYTGEIVNGTWTCMYLCWENWPYRDCVNIYDMTPRPQGGWYGVGMETFTNDDGREENSGILYENGVRIQKLEEVQGLMRVWASADDIYAYSSNGVMYHATVGSNLVRMMEQPSGRVHAIYGDSQPFCFMDHGRITWFSGVYWEVSQEDLGPGNISSNGLWGTSHDNVFVAWLNYPVHFDGTNFIRWGDDGGPGNKTLFDGWVDDHGGLWAVADSSLYNYNAEPVNESETLILRIEARFPPISEIPSKRLPHFAQDERSRSVATHRSADFQRSATAC